MTIIWCMVPEIWSMTDIVFCHSGPFFALLPSYGPRKSKFSKKKWLKQLKILSFYKHKWVMVPQIWSATDRIFCNFGPCLHFYPPNQPKKLKFEKMKKPPGDFITLHMCPINDNHMMHGSWDMECAMDRIFCHFGPFFIFTPLTNRKIKILKKWKNDLEILSV